MQFFATKVHGFNPDRWAGLGFPTDGHLKTVLDKKLPPENLVIHIATEGHETRTDERGLVLGVARLASIAMETSLLVEPELWVSNLIKYEKNRWPRAIPYLEAWTIDNPPRELDVLPRFRQDHQSRPLGNTILEVTADEAATILSLPMTLAALYPYPELLSQMQLNAGLRITRRRSHVWRPPLPTSGSFVHERTDGPAYTYRAMLMGDLASTLAGDGSGAAMFKVGWTCDVDARESNLNFGMPDMERLSWKMDWRYPHATRGDAEQMECEILGELRPHLAERAGSQEIVCASEATMRRAWINALAKRHPEFVVR